ncbi:TetR/AcrR family transcriptional regulator [Nocardia asteroides]|uniref:TetR/AcrR family transcriptional regulator n=1 Tax=Nocardia asteroides TaxID=1824 RepID=UPI0037B44A3C
MTGRRSQAERSAETIGNLVEATIDAIADVGYHRTSLNEVCARAHVSRGGLFRHFSSRLDLVVAAAEEVGRRHVSGFRDQFAAGEVDGIDGAVRYVRNAIRERTNAVWFELLVAARTDAELRERLAPVAEAMFAGIEANALRLISADRPDPEFLRLLTTSLIHLFDGEAIFRITYPRPELEHARLELTVQALEGLRARARRRDAGAE